MPQNAIIRADGTGDYATLSAWAITERTSNYGAPTRCYIDGVVASGAVVLFHTATGGWPNGAELYALTGQAFDGTNLSTCAAITHTTGPIDIGDVDVDIQGLLIDVTGGYNNKNIKFAFSVSTTKRRKITLKNVALRSSPNYHGASCTLDLRLDSTNLNNQYDLDIADVIIIPRANNAAFSLAATSGALDISGTVKNITILPSNSGSSVKTGFALGLGSACTVDVSSVLSLGSEVRTAYIDYSKDAGFGGTATNIVTKDATGTITGKTTATELENYAAGDYRLKTSGLGFGAFKQAVGPSTYISDVAFSWPVISAASSQSSTVPGIVSNASVNWPLLSVLSSQQSDTPQYTGSANLTWPALLISADQVSTLPDYNSDTQILWPLLSVQALESFDLPSGSNSVAITWPIASISASQTSEVPEFSASLSFNWPIFNVDSSVDILEPVSGSTIAFSWPAISVLSDQSLVTPSYDSSAIINWPMFEFYALSGDFAYFTDPQSRADIEYATRVVDIPSLSRRVDI